MNQKYRWNYINFDVFRYGSKTQRQIYMRQLEEGIAPRNRIKVMTVHKDTPSEGYEPSPLYPKVFKVAGIKGEVM